MPDMTPIAVEPAPSRRSAYRVVPDPDDPVILQIDGLLVRVEDISADGMSIPEGTVEPGRRYPFSLDLPSSVASVQGYLDVRADPDRERVRCRFMTLQPGEADLLHHYVLVRQKEVIRALKAGRMARGA